MPRAARLKLRPSGQVPGLEGNGRKPGRCSKNNLKLKIEKAEVRRRQGTVASADTRYHCDLSTAGLICQLSEQCASRCLIFKAVTVSDTGVDGGEKGYVVVLGQAFDLIRIEYVIPSIKLQCQRTDSLQLYLDQ